MRAKGQLVFGAGVRSDGRLSPMLADRMDTSIALYRAGKVRKLLVSGDRTALPRQRTLRALIDWSYDLLDPTEQIVFNRLAVFAFAVAASLALLAVLRWTLIALGAALGLMLLSVAVFFCHIVSLVAATLALGVAAAWDVALDARRGQWRARPRA